MFRHVLVWLMLALVLACGACGNESTRIPPEEPIDAGRDASEPAADAGDAGETGGPLVTNAGDPCDNEADCEGAGPTCIMTFDAPIGVGGVGGGAGPNVSFPEGYCSADCSDSAQCGPGSECGVAELIKLLQPILQTQGIDLPAGVDIPSQCLAICQLSASCRDGYACQGLLDYVGLAAQIPFPLPTKRYCLPAPNTPPLDGGVDAGDDEDGGP